MDTLLKDVVRGGTAARANILNRPDLAGKTGTTNDSIDAWFAGYQPSLVAVAWLGFDQPRNMAVVKRAARWHFLSGSATCKKRFPEFLWK